MLMGLKKKIGLGLGGPVRVGWLKVLYITKIFYYFLGEGGSGPLTGSVPDSRYTIINRFYVASKVPNVITFTRILLLI